MFHGNNHETGARKKKNKDPVMFFTFLPLVVYWTTSLACWFGGADSRENAYHPNNTVTPWQAARRVLTLHALQVTATLPSEWGMVAYVEPFGCRWYYLLGGVLLMDTVQYFSHRLFHEVPWLYGQVHKTHHEIKAPWGFAALYNSYPDALLVGASLHAAFFVVGGFTVEEFSYVVSAANVMTVLDHVDYFDRVSWFGKPRHHRIHHEVNSHTNFQQPFFTFWDRWLGTQHVRLPHPNPPVATTSGKNSANAFGKNIHGVCK